MSRVCQLIIINLDTIGLLRLANLFRLILNLIILKIAFIIRYCLQLTPINIIRIIWLIILVYNWVSKCIVTYQDFLETLELIMLNLSREFKNLKRNCQTGHINTKIKMLGQLTPQRQFKRLWTIMIVKIMSNCIFTHYQIHLIMRKLEYLCQNHSILLHLKISNLLLLV